MTTYFSLRLALLVHVTTCLKQFEPMEILNISENACVLVFLSGSNDVYLPHDTEVVLKTLSAVSFISEPLVHIGYINFISFSWPNNQTLKSVKNEQLTVGDLVLFEKIKIDRTCLLAAKPFTPKVNIYKGVMSINLILDFINNHCGTYRTVKGSLTYEGLHREEILRSLFTVASVSNVTSDKVFPSKKTEQNICYKDRKDEDIDCAKSENLSNFNGDWGNNDMPRCERISMPTKEDFFHSYLKISKPVIIEGGAKMWPAMLKWSNDFLQQEFGHHNVHIKLTPKGEFEGVELAELWNNFKTFKIPNKVRQQLEFPDLVVVRPATLNMQFSELVDLIENVSDGHIQNVSAYLEYSSIPQHLPELENDIQEMSVISDMLTREHLNIWFSDGNTIGKLHFDQYDNFLCQISGRKQVILFEPHDNTRLYEGHIPEAMLAYDHSSKQFTRKQLSESTSMVMSPVDLSKVDFERFPRFAETYPLNCTIDEGDVLFMPAFWWHEVQSFPNKTAKRNLAVNFWYDPFLTKEFPCPTCKLDINPRYRHLL